MPYPELALLTQMLGRPTMLALLLEGRLHDAAWAERHGVLTRIADDLEGDLTDTTARILAVRRSRTATISASRGWP
jgi:enoyl-CoA hydratase/carnithine racemase